MKQIESFTRLVNKILGKESTYSQQDMIVVEQALTELEELKRDVKKYFELANVGDVTEEVLDEFTKIRDKLMEIGNEE